MTRLGHYARVYAGFVRTCVIREMSFRGHFFLLSFSNAAWTILSLAFAGFLFRNLQEVAGWNLERMIVLTGTFSLVLGLLDCFFQTNMARLSEQVNRGELDYVLIKPIDSQFYVSTRYLNLNEVPSIVIALVTVITGLIRLGMTPSLWDILSYGYMVLCAVVTFYGIWFATVTLALWTGRINNIAYLLLPIAELGRLPADIYQGGFRFVLTAIVPVVLISTAPSRAILGLLEPGMLALATVWSVVAVWGSHWFWRFSLSRYTSASS